MIVTSMMKVLLEFVGRFSAATSPTRYYVVKPSDSGHLVSFPVWESLTVQVFVKPKKL